MEVKITKPEIGVVAVVGASLWQNDDATHIKPKGGQLVKAEYIDGGSWEYEDSTHIRPTGECLVNATHIDGMQRAISFYISGDLSDTLKAYFQVPFSLTIDSILMSVGTAPAGSDLIIDINKNGTTLYTTQANRPTIATGNTTATITDPDITSLTTGDVLSVDIDQVTTAKDLMITIICNE